jgi:hypothetical protein
MNIDVTQWEQLEKERELTMSDPKFQQWMSELNVSQSYEDPTLKLNARDVQSQYDVKRYQKFFS